MPNWKQINDEKRARGQDDPRGRAFAAGKTYDEAMSLPTGSAPKPAGPKGPGLFASLAELFSTRRGRERRQRERLARQQREIDEKSRRDYAEAAKRQQQAAARAAAQQISGASSLRVRGELVYVHPADRAAIVARLEADPSALPAITAELMQQHRERQREHWPARALDGARRPGPEAVRRSVPPLRLSTAEPMTADDDARIDAGIQAASAARVDGRMQSLEAISDAEEQVMADALAARSAQRARRVIDIADAAVAMSEDELLAEDLTRAAATMEQARQDSAPARKVRRP